MNDNVIIREYRPGDPSMVCYFYYKLYEKQFDFNGTVERYFIEGMADLFQFPGENMLWVAEQDGRIVGSIAIIKRGDHDAQLRWFGTDMSLQGMGIGNRLLQTAMQFCKEHDYRHVTLWTIDILKPARHLYGKFGFVRTDTKPNHEWASYPLIEEKWEYNI